MSKFRIEIQITVLTIIIGIVVVTIGYFSYKSLSQIVYSIQQGAHPDDKLFIIKDIATDLTALENSVRLYTLTKDNADIEAFYSLEENIEKKVEELINLKEENKFDFALIDSISELSREKIKLWNEILTVHLSSKSMFPAFSELYSNLDELKIDTIPEDSDNNEISQINVDSENTNTDTVFSDRSLERTAIKKDIQKLEWELYQIRKQRNEQESRLIEKNVILVEKINKQIKKAEKMTANEFLEKTVEADRLAEITYKRLALYTFSAVLLLLLALFVLFNYLKKTRAIQFALADARKKAEALAHAKEQFAANVSHELRTPVNAIYGLSEQVLQKKELDTDTSEMVSVIFKSAGHLRNIVNDTLDFSKIQSNNITFESGFFSPEEIFNEIYSLVKYDATNKGIALKFEWEGEKPGILIGDSLRLKQIIINLISNAIKFTEKGEVVALVKGFKQDDQNFELEIQVLDTGMGIEENNLAIIFDEYVQIGNHAGKKYSGTGLGLSIVKKLVELQGGKIKFESKPGEGTKVTVNIGYRIGNPSKIEQAKNEIPEIPESFRQLSILIADDEEYNRFLLKNILQKWGMQYKEAKNGNEAFSIACKEYFDIILMDINMPEMNGIEAAKAIAECNPDIKIVAVTAVTDQLDQQACLKAGMKGFLFKPYSEKELIDTINSLINDNLKNSNESNTGQLPDFSELRHLAGDDDKFFSEMLLLFIKSMDTGITGIEAAIINKKWNEVIEKAHKMAAPVKHIGASHLYEKIKELEKLSQQSVKTESVSQVFREIKNEIEELNNLLKSYLKKLNV